VVRMKGNFRLRVPVQFFQRTGNRAGVDNRLVSLIALLQLPGSVPSARDHPESTLPR
jgi:hypothetical protein